jgi:hypothetical protein
MTNTNRVSIDADTYYSVRAFLSVAIGALEQKREIYAYTPEEISALFHSMLDSADFIFPSEGDE